MRKLLIIIVMILFLFSGCNEGANNSEMTPPSISINPVSSAIPSATFEDADPHISSNSLLDDNYEQLNIINISYLADNSLKYINISDWQTYIQEKFDLELYVNYRAMNAKDLLNKTRIIDEIIYLNFPRGLISAWNSDVYEYGDARIANELSSYYQKYGWGEYIEQDYITALSINGGIYAVPAVNSKYIVPRYYNAKYLEVLDMDIPASIDEFYDYLKAAKAMKKGDISFYPMCVPAYALTQSLSDIFRAYDVYMNSTWKTSISYNPNTASFEDAVYSDGAEPAITFIRGLQQENLMLIYGLNQYVNDEYPLTNRFENNINSFSKEFATEYNYVFDSNRNTFIPFAVADSTYDQESGYYLSYTNSKNVSEVRSDLAFYVFPKAIENIDGTIELFNQIFTDSDYYADLRYGMEDTDYYVIDGIPVMIPPLKGSFVDLKLIKPMDDNSASYAPDSIMIIEGLTNEVKFEKNVFNQVFTYLDTEKYNYARYDNNIDILFYKSVSPYDAITEYKKEFKKTGRLAAINELNEKISAISLYDYND